MSKTRILEAARTLDLDVVKTLAEKQPSLLQVTDPRGRNLLLIACSAYCPKLKVPESTAARMVAFLLDHGLDLESTITMETPCNSVWFAVARGRNATVVKLLVKRGAKPSGLFAAGWYNDIPMLDLLLKSGAELDEYAEDETPFLHCWKNQRFESAKFLVRKGANVNFQNSKGKTALHYAIEKEFDPTLIRFLVSHGASPDIEDRDGISARLKASRKRNKQFLEALT